MKITIPIGEEDIRLFQELIYYDREPFEWRFDGVDIKFIKEMKKNLLKGGKIFVFIWTQ